jgi:hypothetical protein
LREIIQKSGKKVDVISILSSGLRYKNIWDIIFDFDESNSRHLKINPIKRNIFIEEMSRRNLDMNFLDYSNLDLLIKVDLDIALIKELKFELSDNPQVDNIVLLIDDLLSTGFSTWIVVQKLLSYGYKKENMYLSITNEIERSIYYINQK